MSNLNILDGRFVLTLVSVGVLVLIKLLVNLIISSYVSKYRYSKPRKVTFSKLVNFILVIAFIISVSFIWNLTFEGLSIFFASFFTVAGIALFGNWSILSNVTASLILFFNYPFKIGDYIKILDGVDSVEGEVVDINLFNIRMLTTDKKTIAFPNNLAMQKAIVKVEKEILIKIEDKKS